MTTTINSPNQTLAVLDSQGNIVWNKQFTCDLQHFYAGYYCSQIGAGKNFKFNATDTEGNNYESSSGTFTIERDDVNVSYYIGNGTIANLLNSSLLGVRVFDFDNNTLSILLSAYGFVASVLPVWLLLAPRDYLSSFMKIGVIFLLAVGVLYVSPNLNMPPVTRFIHGGGPIIPGTLFAGSCFLRYFLAER